MQNFFEEIIQRLTQAQGDIAKCQLPIANCQVNLKTWWNPLQKLAIGNWLWQYRISDDFSPFGRPPAG